MESRVGCEVGVWSRAVVGGTLKGEVHRHVERRWEYAREMQQDQVPADTGQLFTCRPDINTGCGLPQGG